MGPPEPRGEYCWLQCRKIGFTVWVDVGFGEVGCQWLSDNQAWLYRE